MNDTVTKNIKAFLERLNSELNVKNSSFGLDKDGFFVWIKNSNCQCKRILLGEEDMNKTQDEMINEIKELIASQKW